MKTKQEEIETKIKEGSLMSILAALGKIEKGEAQIVTEDLTMFSLPQHLLPGDLHAG